MESQKLLEKLAYKVKNKTLFVLDQSLRYQRGLGYRSFAPVKLFLPEQSSGITCLTLERNKKSNKIYTFNIHCCYCLRYRNKACNKNKVFVTRARTTSKWTIKMLCAQKKIAFELITPQAFVVSMIAYKQRVKFLLALINELPFTFRELITKTEQKPSFFASLLFAEQTIHKFLFSSNNFVQPFQILGLKKLYEVCGTKKRYLPVTSFLCSCHFGNTTNSSMNPMYSEDIRKLKFCSTFVKPNSYILKRCAKLNDVSDYRILALRSSAILCQERKKLKIIRPLLDLKRESITMVCKDLQIPVYPDKSNRSVQYSRNRIRKQIIPSIKHFINPQVESSLFKVAQLLQKEQFFVYSLLKNTSVNIHL